jgi:hypothetical protein
MKRLGGIYTRDIALHNVAIVDDCDKKRYEIFC